MSLEGNLRDLQLPEVFQLLAHGRKSGQLRITATLAGLSAVVCFERGAITDATVAPAPLNYDTIADSARTGLQVESAALELLTWRDGIFTFVPAAEGSSSRNSLRLPTAMLLVEGARRMEAWARLADRIPHARAVPTFVTIEPTHLPLLHLVPQQWEVLTRVDGQRDLPALADALGRDLLEVAGIVHGLIAMGLLMLVDAARPVRALATPPSTATVASETPAEAGDIWVPRHIDNSVITTPLIGDAYDAIFDPVSVGVLPSEGLPRLHTPRRLPAVVRGRSAVGDLRRAGDEAARRGDLEEALVHWNRSLDVNRHGSDAEYVREAIALAERLNALLNTHVTN